MNQTLPKRFFVYVALLTTVVVGFCCTTIGNRETGEAAGTAASGLVVPSTQPAPEQIDITTQRGRIQAGLQSTVAIHYTGTHQIRILGSGVAVRKGYDVYIWTAAHCVGDFKDEDTQTKVGAWTIYKTTDGFKVEAIPADTKGTKSPPRPVASYGKGVVLIEIAKYSDGGWEQWWRSAEVVEADGETDLALLKLTDAAPPQLVGAVFDTRLDPVFAGDAVFHVGNNTRVSHTPTLGTVGAPLRGSGSPRNPDVWDSYLQVQIQVWHGSSGGGIFDSSSGSVLGILVFVDPTYQLTFAIPSHRIKDWAVLHKLDHLLPEIDQP